MRNIFDQYRHPENRLTHALVSALGEDRRLLRQFVKWTTGQRVRGSEPLQIIEQGLPGDHADIEEDAEKRGLPDACIYQGERWALLIESKVAAPLRIEQLQRHFRTASRRGLQRVSLLALSVDDSKMSLPPAVAVRTWSEVYAWLVKQSCRSEWARRASDYFVVAENRMVGEGYLKEGTLTTFAGIPFENGEPYNYPEAKRLLKLAMEELREKRELVRELNMDANRAGRGAITGKDGAAVWDFLPLKGLNKTEVFTSSPHLTLAIEADRLLAIITIPHGIKPRMRRNLVELGYEAFQELMARLNRQLIRALSNERGAAPWVVVVQRRYPTQRSAAIVDARIEYDLRTAFPDKRQERKVRLQPEWLRATYDALSHKRSNLQVAVGASFPYNACPSTKDHRIVDYVARTWLACKPLLDVMLK